MHKGNPPRYARIPVSGQRDLLLQEREVRAGRPRLDREKEVMEVALPARGREHQKGTQATGSRRGEGNNRKGSPSGSDQRGASIKKSKIDTKKRPGGGKKKEVCNTEFASRRENS